MGTSFDEPGTLTDELETSIDDLETSFGESETFFHRRETFFDELGTFFHGGETFSERSGTFSNRSETFGDRLGTFSGGLGDLFWRVAGRIGARLCPQDQPQPVRTGKGLGSRLRLVCDTAALHSEGCDRWVSDVGTAKAVLGSASASWMGSGRGVPEFNQNHQQQPRVGTGVYSICSGEGWFGSQHSSEAVTIN